MAVSITRAEPDAAGLRHAATRTRDAGAARRMLALALVLDGHSRTDAAQSCGIPGGRLTLPSNISILTLPAYAPELNPQENIWQFLRQNYLANRVFDTYDHIVQACCDAWNALMQQPQRIITIATREWAKQVNL